MKLKKRNKRKTLVFKYVVMILDHLVWPFDVLSRIIKYCLVIVTSYSFIDASTEGYEEEEVYEEEGDHFDHQPNQGKL